MNISDFRYMRQGKQLKALNKDESHLLKPICLQGDNKKRALLLLHGFSSSPAVYRCIIPYLKNYDAILCPVLPGHAITIESFSQVKACDWLQNVKALCDRLTTEYEQVDLLGLSLGGLLACELSKEYVINHLYLLAPALKLRLNTKLIIPTIRMAKRLGFNQVRNAAGNILNPNQAEITYRMLPLTTIIEVLQLIQDFQWIPPTCATSLFLGAQDQVVDSEWIRDLYKSLSNCELHWLANSAHVLPLDNDVAQIISCINSHSKD